MTPMNEQHYKELEARAATSHDVVPNTIQDEVVESAEKAKSVEEHQAARRDFLAGIRKLIKSFKSLSHIFEMYKEGDEEEGIDMNIEIGFPTNVQHVAHIGLDGSSNIATLEGLEGAKELLSLSNLSIEQFELAMASLAPN